jgi:isopenicillin-N epimerase
MPCARRSKSSTERPARSTGFLFRTNDESLNCPERHGWQGTRDPAAYLSVPKAIELHASYDLEGAAALADEAERRLAELGLPRIPGRPAPFMRAVELPPGDRDELWSTSYEDYRVEVPVYVGRPVHLRVSIGSYNDESDVDRLVSVLEQLLEAREPPPATREGGG